NNHELGRRVSLQCPSSEMTFFALCEKQHHTRERELNTSAALRKNPRDPKDIFLFRAPNRPSPGCAGRTASLPTVDTAVEIEGKCPSRKKSPVTSKTHAMDRDEYRTQPGLSRRTFEDTSVVRSQTCFSVFKKPLLRFPGMFFAVYCGISGGRSRNHTGAAERTENKNRHSRKNSRDTENTFLTSTRNRHP
ncbi:MAG: uncharacterized protein A8A55_2392, partial [Amphiamblys sp. WSBS2006]